nr:R3H domain-containing nucleic acid-binding protein [uncultured Holophaga sp.]
MRRNSASLESLPDLAVRWCEALGLKVEARFEASGDDELFPNRLVLDGPDAQWLAASKGQGLDALQFLIHEAQGERDEARLAYLDAQGSRLFRMKEIKAMAALAIQQARATGSYRFSSLTPRERRWVHTVVAREQGLNTESEGTGSIKALKVFRA